MSILIEKKNELKAKLTQLEEARKMEIDAKVQQYRATLEAQTSTEHIDRLKTVICALDEVITYEDVAVQSMQEVSHEPIARPEIAHFAQPIVQTDVRPGMNTIVSPSRV